jgi:hypothetical protein
MEFPGKMIGGRLRLSPAERARYDAYAATLSGDVVLTLETAEEKRSAEANAYWFGAIVEFFRKVWSEQYRKPFDRPDYTKEEAHDVLVQYLLGFEDGPHGTRLRRRTRDLKQSDFSRLIDGGKEMAWQDYQVRIPDPDEWKALQS